MRFFGWLTILFIALKLCNMIAWSWWLVLLPLYFPLAFGAGLWALWVFGVFGVAGTATLAAIAKEYSQKNKKR